MRNGRSREKQIVSTNRQIGITDADLCIEVKVLEPGRLYRLEEENRRLKKLLVESMLDVATLREALAKTHGA